MMLNEMRLTSYQQEDHISRFFFTAAGGKRVNEMLHAVRRKEPVERNSGKIFAILYHGRE
jgi:hypothetical protein